MKHRRVAFIAAGAAAACALAAAALTIATLASLRAPPDSLAAVVTHDAAPQVLDRHGTPLSVTFTNAWNVHDRVPLYDVPPFLRDAFVVAEDRRFWQHRGTDWRARLAALTANMRHARAVRGASTITEQVVRMLNPRPRTLFSRWLEGWEARRLERRFTKAEILEWYLDQVPYGSNRRGIAQAARYYFDRDLGTLNRKEMLTLAVLVRAPSRLDPRRAPGAAEDAVARLSAALVERGLLYADEGTRVLAEPLELAEPRLPVRASHFVRHARAEARRRGLVDAEITTTLDGPLQRKVQALLDERLHDLAPLGVRDGAALVIAHGTGEILAWAVGGGADPAGPRTHIDTVKAARQPGSVMKPFVYALALEHGWTAAEIIVDAPLTESASGGLHNYRNYSRRHYGPVTLRDALGNSLNVPAVKTLQFVGATTYLETLRALGFDGLSAHPDHYGDGIALGTAEVTLLDLVEAYAALAAGGIARASSPLLRDAAARPAQRVFSREAATLIGHILSDPEARALEFGHDTVLRFPVQTAVKTGTSSDFRDAWTVGFDDRYVVGVWMGNLDRTPTNGVTGSIGPALLLRSIFSELSRRRPTRALPLAPALERHEVCVPLPFGADAPVEAADLQCVTRDEWFLPGTAPPAQAHRSAAIAAARIRFRQPTPGLKLAFDPRLPPEAQAFQLALDGVLPDDDVRWSIDGKPSDAHGPTLLWPLERGAHRVSAKVQRAGVTIASLPEIEFTVR